ncbi:MAG: LamG domain-containing protein [Phycisphaerales bacterium]
MKNRIKWMVLVIAAAVYSSSCAGWNPDADASLVFNMNFENYNNAEHTTTEPVRSVVGSLTDYNSTNYNVFGQSGFKGYDANFAAAFDQSPGKATSDQNDCTIRFLAYNYNFDLGDFQTDQRTFTFWFKAPNFDGTIIRHAYKYMDSYEDYKNAMWEIRMAGTKLHFYHKDNCLRMETANTLTGMGLALNEWHHAAIVFDRRTRTSSKIYIDGLEVPVMINAYNTANANVEYSYEGDPVWIGGGEREFEGCLDEIKLYHRVLTPVEVSLIKQDDGTVKAKALLPIPNSSNVSIISGLSWEPIAGATAQEVYFGTSSESLASVATGNGTLSSVSNAALGGQFVLNSQYYWRVDTTTPGGLVTGPVWAFTAESGKALTPRPADGAEDISVTDVNLVWTSPTAGTYDVYCSTNRALVEANDVSVRVTTGITDTFVEHVPTLLRSAVFYWRVNTTYTSSYAAGDIWSFRTKPYEIVFNTATKAIEKSDHEIAALGVEVHGNGWYGLRADGNSLAFPTEANVVGHIAADGTVIYDFNTFNFDRRFDIVVIPEYPASDINEYIVPRPIAIHVKNGGSFYFDGRINIAGDGTASSSTNAPEARCGGYPGPKNNQNSSIFPDRKPPIVDYWTSISWSSAVNRRLNDDGGSGKNLWIPTALAKTIFGPGVPVEPPYKGGGGGGYGGLGGDAGRGFDFGVDSRGSTYGAKEIPVPFGGSAGGWGGDQSPAGCSGGGGIEIVAAGNVTLDEHSVINANGGSDTLATGYTYPNGGGSGGSVKIIAGGTVTTQGIITANGGKGGNGSVQANNTGGGGGGGRVAIFYGTAFDNLGTITVDGGAKGMWGNVGLAHDGQKGTIYITNTSPKKASGPIPVDKDVKVYCPNSVGQPLTLKWYSGYNVTSANDVVYFGTVNPPTTVLGQVTNVDRSQKSLSTTLSKNTTYYWYVKTVYPGGSVNSEIWSFKTVGWECPIAVQNGVAHVSGIGIAGPEWDNNHDCLLNEEDFFNFALDWQDSELSPVVNFDTLRRFANEWLDCYARTKSGCSGF